MRIHPFQNPRFLLPLVVLALILPSSIARATTRVVSSLADSGAGTLRDTIAASSNGDTITFSVTGAINLTSGSLTISNSITINGPGANLLEVTRTSGVFGIFVMDSGSTVTIAGIAITNGHGVLQSSTFYGGGISNNGGTFTLSNCIISDNTAEPDGGAILTVAGSVTTVTDCTFSNNTAAEGGAISSSGQLTVTSCTFSGNHTSDNGGAITNYGAGQLAVDNCTFSQNNAVNGGAIFNYGFGGATLVATVRNSTFTGNGSSTQYGGAISSQFGTVNLSDCTVVNNTASTAGGGIYNANGTLTLRNDTLANNTAGTGGGIYNLGSSDGFAANATVSNSTVSGNSAPDGGGIYNTGTNGGNAFVMLDNTILASTSGMPGANLVNTGLGTSITSQGYNLSSDDGGGFLTAGGDQINTNPQLGALQDNGGPTATMALLPGSPALDQGKNFGVTTDQRGRPRPVDLPTIPNASGGDGSDIGAVEMDIMQTGPTFVVNTTADHDDGVCDLGDCTLREAINVANIATGENTIVFRSGVTGVITLQSALGPLTVTDSVTITGPGARLLAVSGNDAIRVFSFNSGSSAISGLKIVNGTVIGAAGSGGVAEGGGVLNASNSSLSLSDCRISGNHVQGGDHTATASGVGGSGSGGAIANSGVLTLNGCTLSGNNAVGGRGGDAVGGIGHSVVGGTGGAGQGGAIFNDTSATLTITNSSFASNIATGGAGGNFGTGQFGGNGGNATAGVFNQGTMTVTAATLTGNAGAGGAGGNGSNMFNNGSPGVGRGGFTAGSGTSVIRNTISAGNTGNHGGGPDVDGTFISQGYNLIGIGDSSAGFNATGDQVGTSAAPINAMLGSLQDNGGSTNTVGLLTSSPAVDKGKSFGLASDQRGLSLFDNPDVPNAVGGDGRDIGAFELSGAPPLPTTLANISTRLRVETGDNVLIGGFIVTGTQPKRVIVRAIGPSLSLPGALADPILELHGPASFATITNDNWRSTQEAEIIATGIPPPNDLESAIVATLPANNSAYTAIVRGVNNGTGIGVVEAYDLDRTVDSKLANISTRGLVQTGDNVMIGGLIVVGQNSLRVIVRAIGPSLPLPGALGDPTLELRDINGALIAANDNWRSDQEAEIIATTIPPTNDLESAIVRNLVPGNYTAIVRGVNNTTGVALVEVYALN